MSKALTMKIFMPEGDPEGLRIVETFGWSGKIIASSRSDFLKLKKRPELQGPGVYFLAGSDNETQEFSVYIGEADPLLDRLVNHHLNKDFWSNIYLFTCYEIGQLNKAHIQYLESRIVEKVAAAKKCLLENKNFPKVSSLAESDAAEMEKFLDQMIIGLELLGLDIFDAPKDLSNLSATLEYQVKAGGEVLARGVETSQGFFVRSGSRALTKVAPSMPVPLQKHRNDLISRKVLIETNGYLQFVQDYQFSSPSLASGVILGRSSNGRVDWRTENGETLKDVQIKREAKNS